MAVGLSSLTDIEVLQRVANYDSRALETLYNRYSPLLYSLIKKIVEDPKEAETILIDVFVIVWQKINFFDFKTSNAYCWLVTLARNKAIDTARRKRNGESSYPVYNDEYENNYILPHLSPQIDDLDLKTASSIRENIEDALHKLTDAQQYVLYLGYYEGLTISEISQRLKIPVQTVKSKIQVALESLKDNLLKGEE
ncbi:MAG TPA: sigma-70 family RNA polymerase sigma factor [Ignavibacteriaceae bacterium]|nr:sigma-70 family RNA polymerase sigma factor [Ignavibacteriaceae bacterium]